VPLPRSAARLQESVVVMIVMVVVITAPPFAVTAPPALIGRGVAMRRWADDVRSGQCRARSTSKPSPSRKPAAKEKNQVKAVLRGMHVSCSALLIVSLVYWSTGIAAGLASGFSAALSIGHGDDH
jgi:hypothetical protein